MQRATAQGTETLRTGSRLPASAYRPLQDLTTSALSVGTYLGGLDEATDRAYEDAIVEAVRAGLNGIDTAVNYRCMRSERAVGAALARLFKAGEADRSQVIVATKGGYVPFDGAPPADRAGWLQERFIRRGLCTAEEIVGGQHCLAPKYLQDQLETSLSNLGLEAVDVYYLHNPETQLRHVPRATFLARMRAAFEVLERNASEGKLSWYGTATWNGYRVAPSAAEHLSLEELVAEAEKVAGATHRFRVVQLPLNLKMTEAKSSPTQRLRGAEVTLLEAARELGITVMASAPLLQAELAKGANAERALRFVLGVPGVASVLCGMKQAAHVRENLRALGTA